MLISAKQHEANRRNAQNSTGPKTPEGKEAVRFNALTYGLRTRATILANEDVSAYIDLWDEFEAEYQPQTRTEWTYLESMAVSQWLLIRLAKSEKAIYENTTTGEKQMKLLSYVYKQRSQLERSFRNAVKDMKQAQKERQAIQPQPAPAAKPLPEPTPTPPPAYIVSEAASPVAEASRPVEVVPSAASESTSPPWASA